MTSEREATAAAANAHSAPGALHPDVPPAGRGRLAASSLTALGVVYGDIGTSPLYAIRQCFRESAAMAASPANILGIVSLIFWALILVISIKYLVFVMRADNRGEGGILALLALLDPWHLRSSPRARWLIFLGLFGAALLFGDGLITPAISVLSAVEGLGVAAPELQSLVIPMTAVILILLFIVQKRGTASVGRVFGPVMLLWFAVIGCLGVRGILHAPRILAALDPTFAFDFLWDHQLAGYMVLGAVFLAVTGGEALYADMGHFGSKPIRLAWFTVVLPGLVLNYFGQGALVLAHPGDAVHPFYHLVPAWGTYPMIVLATVVTVIASQAVISGLFSLTRQAVQMGQWPPLRIVQTSSEEIGQIYIPFVNWALLVGTIALVVGFGSSANLAAAYGVAVSATMVITTILIFFVMRDRWRWHPLAVGCVTFVFLIVDGAFFGANLAKILDGGWFPLVVAGAVVLLMTTWGKGRKLLLDKVRGRSITLETLIASLRYSELPRISGTAVFLTGIEVDVPGGLLHQLKLNQVLHERVVLLTCITEEIPSVPAANRLQVASYTDGFYRLHVHYGFMQSPNVPVAVRLCQERGLIPGLDAETTVYFADRATLSVSVRPPGMRLWRKKLFGFMSRNALRAIDYYRLPPGRSVELGIQVEL